MTTLGGTTTVTANGQTTSTPAQIHAVNSAGPPASGHNFGTLFADGDGVAQRIRDDIAPKVAADSAYQNARKNTPNTARREHDKALAKVMLTLLKDDTQVYKQFVENESFQRFVTDMVYGITNSSQSSA